MFIVLGITLSPVTLAMGEPFFPAEEIARDLGWRYEYDPVTEIAQVAGRTIDPGSPRLWDGTYLLSRQVVTGLGATVSRDVVRFGGRTVRLARQGKRVMIDLGDQQMRAFEGSREVIRCKVSTGRPGKETPTGLFFLGRKDRAHVSSIYHTPMPWSVHVTGGVFIHGSEWFSNTPGSHGCIRLDMHGETDWANWFFDWAEAGVPVSIRR